MEWVKAIDGASLDLAEVRGSVALVQGSVAACKRPTGRWSGCSAVNGMKWMEPFLGSS